MLGSPCRIDYLVEESRELFPAGFPTKEAAMEAVVRGLAERDESEGWKREVAV